MTHPVTEQLGESGLTGLTDAIPNRLAKQTQRYDVEYGVRADDQAMIFHFYPPGTDWTSYPPVKLGSWDGTDMHTRLEGALTKTFDRDTVKGSYTEETRSFCIIVKGLGHSLNPDHFVQKFFDAIEDPL